MSEAPAAPPTTAPAEDAAITTRLAAAVSDFQAGRTARALTTLADLLDEAPQRDDLRLTAEQWAKSLRAQTLAIRASVPRPPPGQIPQPIRRAEQQVRAAQAALDGGDALQAARGFEAARAAWSQIAARRAQRAESGPPPAEPTPAPRVEPAQPTEDERAASAAPTTPAPTTPAPATQPDLDKAAMMRLLQSFERAFESRSAESLKPIWPSLSPSQQQTYQQQFSRVLHQQWQFKSVTIGIDAEGKRASAISSVTITALPIGARDSRSETRPVTFRFEKVGQIWVIAAVAGL